MAKKSDKAKRTQKSKRRKSKKARPLLTLFCAIEVYGPDDVVVKKTSKIAQSDVPNNMLALLSALRASTSGVS